MARLSLQPRLQGRRFTITTDPDDVRAPEVLRLGGGVLRDVGRALRVPAASASCTPDALPPPAR